LPLLLAIKLGAFCREPALLDGLKFVAQGFLNSAAAVGKAPLANQPVESAEQFLVDGHGDLRAGHGRMLRYDKLSYSPISPNAMHSNAASQTAAPSTARHSS